MKIMEMKKKKIIIIMIKREKREIKIAVL